MSNLREKYDLDEKRGYLPAEDPLRHCPEGSPASFRQLDQLCDDTLALLLCGKFRQAILKLDPSAFDEVYALAEHGEDRLRRWAMCKLSFLGGAFLWGAREPALVLPRVLSKPYCALARVLGRPPVLSYASYCIDNWYKLDPEEPISLDNVALCTTFLGGVDENWFVTVHVAIEAAAGPGLAAALMLADESAKDAPNEGALKCHLTRLGDAIWRMDEIFAHMPEKCDPYVYYHRVRPFIFGSKNNPDLPDGLIYEGEFDGVPQMFRGETGAQSSILPAFDGVLGVQHEKDELRHYLNEMREYMPPKHRDFISHLEEVTKVRSIVEKTPDLQEAYDRCLEGLKNFRSRHLSYAATYIQRQSKTATLVGSGGSTEWGTGGTPFMPYLKKHRDETAAQTIRKAFGCPA